MKPEITNSEAVYAFALWLTSRFEQVTFSIHNSPETGIELAKRFCEANNWAIPEDLEMLEDTIETPPRG